jgi:O-antigen/teichoic acid export membrane protein
VFSTARILIKNLQLFSLQAFNTLRFGSAILIAILLAKIASSEIIHLYESLLLVGTTLTFFYASAINHTLVPAAEGCNKEDRGKTYFSALLFLVFGAVLSIIAMVFYSAYFSNTVERPYILLYAVFILFNTPGLLAENILLIESQKKKLVLYGIVIFSLQLFAVVIPIYLGSIEWALYLLGALGFFKLVFTILLIGKYGSWTLDKDISKKLFKMTYPVMGALFLANGYVYGSNFLVKFQLSEADFNLFRYGTREFPLFMILANSFSTVQSGMLARSAENLGKGLEDMRKACLRLLNQLFPIAILLVLTSKFLFQLAFNVELAPAYQVFNVLLLILLSRVLFPQSVLLALAQNKSMILASFAEFVVGITFSIWFLNIWGIIGIAWAMVVAHMIEKLVLIYFTHKKGIRLDQYLPIKQYALYSLLLLAFVVFWS